MTGCFISVDGIDGAGKSTQVELLCQLFRKRGQEPLTLRDPGGTKLGESLREILLHRQEIPLSMKSEMLLYMASRAQLVEEVIRPALEAETVVISDRYLLANIVYQGHAGGLNIDDIRTVGQVATGGLQPDLTIVFDLPVETALSRLPKSKDRLESRGKEYMSRVREGFLTESKQTLNSMVIDATQSVDAIHQRIAAEITALGL